MKILHCADIHLDSKMTRHLDNEKARLRRNEMINTFCHMVDYASMNDIDVVLIAGDLFDTNKVSVTARNTVIDAISAHDHISFFYLRGNHDLIETDTDKLPGNLHMFNQEWMTYDLGQGVKLTAVELNQRNSSEIYETLAIDERDFNIVMLHGQEAEVSSSNKAELINIRAFRNRGIDYLALGHVHFYKMEKLDYRGNYCYPGCLEGRGFDECGEHGFVTLEIDTKSKKYTHNFVPFAYRNLYELDVDISECRTVTEIERLIHNELLDGDYGNFEKNMFKINLVGAIDEECEKDISYLTASINRYVFFAKINDKTEIDVSVSNYATEESLKGAFVRSVMSDVSISEDEKNLLIRNGIRLISGKELEI